MGTAGASSARRETMRDISKHGVKYFNITDISRRGFEDPALVANDGLHPSGNMYKQWVEVIIEGLK